MAAKRKTFVCKECLKTDTKTYSSYGVQFRKLGYVLCTECSLARNAIETSKRLKDRYAKVPKNNDIVTIKCIDCGVQKVMQRRAIRDGYLRCKSCAAKINREKNKDIYDQLAAARQNNLTFSQSISQGMLSVPFDLRSMRSKCALQTRWNDVSLRFEEFAQRSNHIHCNKYDYSKADYINNMTAITIICPIHGEYKQTPHSHLHHGYGCKRCSNLKAISSGHQEIVDYIHKLGDFTVENNTRNIIPPYEIDIWLPEISIGIEYHGVYWHSYSRPETVTERCLHKIKADYADCNNIRLLQIFETEWIQKKQIIQSIISSKLGVARRIFARGCKVGEVSKLEFKDFMNDNHLQGHRSSSYRLGLYNDDGLVLVIGISRHQKYSYELIRLASKCDIVVVGGFSRLLHHARLDLGFDKLLSYVDRRYSSAAALSYEKIGFKLLSTTKSNYWYTTCQRSLPFYSRQSFQKKKLATKLANYDVRLSESQNMFMNGYRRIWDAGHYKLLFEN